MFFFSKTQNILNTKTKTLFLLTLSYFIRYGPTNTVAGRGGRPSKFDPIIQEPLIQRPNAFGLGASGYKKTFTYGRKIVGKLHPQQLLWVLCVFAEVHFPKFLYKC